MEAAIRAGRAGQPAAIAMAPHENDDPAAELTGRAGPAAPGLTELRALPGLPQAPGVRISGPLRRSQEVTPEPDGDAQPAFDVFMPRQRGQDLAQPPDPGGSYLASPPAGAGPLPGPGSRPDPDPGLAPVPGSAPYPPATPMTPVASPPPGRVPALPWELSGQTGPLPVVPGGPEPTSPAAGSGDVEGLPRRIRQASLAPQLRADPPPRRVTVASSGPSSERTPAEIRQAMSALQRGWQEGRAQQAGSPASGEPPGPPPPGAGEGRDGTTNSEAHGNTDGT